MDNLIENANVQIEIVRIDFTNGMVHARENGKDAVYHFNAGTGTNTVATDFSLRLNDTNFEAVFALLSKFKERTLLIHPAAHRQIPVVVSANPRNKTEAIQSLESALREKGFAIIPDGTKFDMIVPSELATNVIPRSADLPIAKADEMMVAPGMIYFDDVQFEEVLMIYGKLIRREIIQDESLPNRTLSIQSMNPLTKSEVIYALDVLFDWQGVKIANVDDKTAKVVFTNPEK
jgi:hypothetical protein